MCLKRNSVITVKLYNMQMGARLSIYISSTRSMSIALNRDVSLNGCHIVHKIHIMALAFSWPTIGTTLAFTYFISICLRSITENQW